MTNTGILTGEEVSHFWRVTNLVRAISFEVDPEQMPFLDAMGLADLSYMLYHGTYSQIPLCYPKAFVNELIEHLEAQRDEPACIGIRDAINLVESKYTPDSLERIVNECDAARRAHKMMIHETL